DRLRYVTTGDRGDVALTATPKTPEFNALRWLAQVAVNIVDFIDSDDYMTPFNWYVAAYPEHPMGDWVYGTELPRLVLNESYIECVNDPTDLGTSDKRATKPHWVNFWVELHNPFHPDPNLTDSVAPNDPNLRSAARLRMPSSGAKPAYGIYQLQIAQ